MNGLIPERERAKVTEARPGGPALVVPISSDWTTLGTGGGIETFLEMFFKRAADRDIQVSVPCSGAHAGSIGSVQFNPIMLHAPSELAFVRRLRRQLVSGALRLPQRAVVLANEDHYAWAFRRLDLPIVFLSHAALPESLRIRHSALYAALFRFFIERQAVKQARRVVVVNSSIKSYYLSRYRNEAPAKFVEVPIGLEPSTLEDRPRSDPLTRLSPPSRANLVLFVGRLYREKNVGLFIRACDILRNRGESVEGLVIGDGNQRGMLREAIATRPWLHWIPSLTHSEVLDAMAMSRALAVCSRYESGPLVLLEAVCLGTPVVTTDVGRARQIIERDSGRIVLGDPDSFAAGLHEVMSWSRERTKASSMRVRNEADFNNTMDGILAVVKNVG